jgi:ornithine cyclodeaminase/alanine dehydrogenase-like protein (mu-crystallin family)
MLARAGAASVGLIGCGKQGWTQVEAVSRVRDIKQVAVYSRTPQTRDEFAARMGDGLGLPVSAAATAEACVRDKDIVIAATNSAAPVVFAEWLAPGAHVNAVGANAYTRREVDDQTVLGAAIVATDDREQAKLEARELVDLVADGRLAWQDVAELGALVQGTGPKREDDRQITLFKSLGVALEDVAFARLIYHRALEREIGRDLGDI